MNKFYGSVGYAVSKESSPGVWVEEIEERQYYGDVTRNSRQYHSSDKVNDDLNISNEISIVADPYAYDNFHRMKYVVFMGAKWKITNVEVQYPRLTLTIGGLFNEQTN